MFSTAALLLVPVSTHPLRFSSERCRSIWLSMPNSVSPSKCSITRKSTPSFDPTSLQDADGRVIQRANRLRLALQPLLEVRASGAHSLFSALTRTTNKLRKFKRDSGLRVELITAAIVNRQLSNGPVYHTHDNPE